MVSLCIDTIYFFSLKSLIRTRSIIVEVKYGDIIDEHEAMIDPMSKHHYLNLITKIPIKSSRIYRYADITIRINNIRLFLTKIDITKTSFGVKKDKEISIVIRVINHAYPSFSIMDVHRHLISDFDVVNVIGRGSFSTVYKAKSLDGMRALKKIYERPNIEDESDTCLREILPLILVNKHPSIVRLDGFIYDYTCGLILVLEYLDKGSLFDVDPTKYSEEKWISMFYGIFSAISLIHSYGIIHRDISPFNILISSDDTLKIIDFSVTRFVCDNMTSYVGNRNFQSLQVQQGLRYNENADDESLSYVIDGFLSKVGENSFIQIRYLNSILKETKSINYLLYVIELGYFNEFSINDYANFDNTSIITSIDSNVIDIFKLFSLVHNDEQNFIQLSFSFNLVAFDPDFLMNSELNLDSIMNDSSFESYLYCERVYCKGINDDILRKPKLFLELCRIFNKKMNFMGLGDRDLKNVILYFASDRIFHNFENYYIVYNKFMTMNDYRTAFKTITYCPLKIIPIENKEVFCKLAIDIGIKDSIKFLFNLSNKGDAIAQFYLGIYHTHDIKEESKGFYYLYLSAKQGYVKAIFQIATYYMFGIIVERDLSKAKVNFWFCLKRSM